MCNKITLKSMFFCLSLLFFSLAPFCGSNSQAAQLYTISEAQLNQLDKNLQTLEAHNSQKQKLLTQQQKQLAEAQTQLETANRQLEKSRELNKQTQKSLQTASESFKKYETEAEHKIRVKTRQRNLWIVISAIFGTIAITK